MPKSTLACPLSLNYIKQFIPNTWANGIVTNYIKKKTIKTPAESYASDFDLNHAGLAQINNNENRPYISNGVQEIKGLFNHNNKNLSDISVKKWIDYSSKYFLGYILSDGNVGVYLILVHKRSS